MTEKVKTVIECIFLLPDFKSHGHPTHGALIIYNNFNYLLGALRISAQAYND